MTPSAAAEPKSPAATGVEGSPPAAGTTDGHSYGQILRSSVLIGGSTAFNVVTGVVRTKAMALLLGPAGFGLMGLFTAIANLAQTIAGMGINSSGVRQIAAAVGSGDQALIARTAAVVRRASLVLGLSGAVALVALSGFVSRLTFATSEHAFAVALLSLAVLFKVVSDGQGALIQGLRRISALAQIAILGGLSGTLVGIVLVYLFREKGVVPALIASAGATLIFSWWFSRQVHFESARLSAHETAHEARDLLGLGLAFMASGMLAMGAAYVVRMMIVRQIGLEAAGLYQSAWTIGGLYVGFVLQAMGADFYPRLTGLVRNRVECNRLVNEQAQVSMLLAGPGILGTLSLAPFVISLLYSSAFGEAVDVLRWVCLGATLQVITWPIGYIIVAEGRRSVFFWCELGYTVAHLGLAWACLRLMGVDGAGLAFFVSYIVHGLIVYPVVRKLTGFRWSADNLRGGLGFLAVTGVVFASFYWLPLWLATTLGLLATLLSGVHSTRALLRLVSLDRIPPTVRRLLAWVRLAPGQRTP
jgi:enterobacterial common antigen flippase